VIVLDIGLPGRNGFDVAKQLRSEPVLAGVRLVALTGYGTDADRAHAVQSGFDYYLIKPADVDDLREVLAER
jgi:CheY-like chemotaxis protein